PLIHPGFVAASADAATRQNGRPEERSPQEGRRTERHLGSVSYPAIGDASADQPLARSGTPFCAGPRRTDRRLWRLGSESLLFTALTGARRLLARGWPAPVPGRWRGPGAGGPGPIPRRRP